MLSQVGSGLFVEQAATALFVTATQIANLGYRRFPAGALALPHRTVFPGSQMFGDSQSIEDLTAQILDPFAQLDSINYSVH